MPHNIDAILIALCIHGTSPMRHSTDSAASKIPSH